MNKKLKIFYVYIYLIYKLRKVYAYIVKLTKNYFFQIPIASFKKFLNLWSSQKYYLYMTQGLNFVTHIYFLVDRPVQDQGIK